MKRNLYQKWLVLAAFCMGSTAMISAQNSEPSQSEVEFEVSQTTGTWTAHNKDNTWHSEWTSTKKNPVLRLNCAKDNSPKNNMAYTKDGAIMLFTGDQNVGYSADYTLSVEAGYNIVAYSFDFTNEAGKNVEVVVTPSGSPSTIGTDAPQTISVTGIHSPSTIFNVKHKTLSAKGFAIVNKFKVTVQKDPNAIIPQYLYETQPNAIPYRIPALAINKEGHLLAFSDYRPSRGDIGSGEVDIQLRISTDNGLHWEAAKTIADGQDGQELNAGFGDAAVVGDRESNEVLMLCVAGRTPYNSANFLTGNPNRMVRFISKDGGQNWEYTEITGKVYNLFANSKTPVQSMFVGSGKLIQSSTIKGVKYHRVYAPLCARPGGNRVMYSDDFGENWKALGGIEALPCPGGDEPKCEELPDGRILLSSRVEGGRYFNIFTYTNKETGEGVWDTPAMSDNNNQGTYAGDKCNGEIMILPVKRNSDNKQMFLALQSVPYGPGRSHVSIYFKPLERPEDYADPATFAKNWAGRYEVTSLGSAYSTMILQKDSLIGFFYEEETHGSTAKYTNVYKTLSLEQITKNLYSYDSTSPKPKADANTISAADLAEAKKFLARTGLGFPRENCETRSNLTKIVNAFSNHTKAELTDAVQKFIAEEDVETPEVGNVYSLTFIASDKKEYYLNLEGDKIVPVLRSTTELPESACFLAVNVENSNEIGLVTQEGKYLCYPTKTPLPNWLDDCYASALTDNSSPINALTFQKAKLGANVENMTNEKLFGLFFIQSLRGYKKTDKTPVKGYWIVKTTDQTYDGTDTPFFNATFSSLIRIERVIAPLGKQVTTLEEVDPNKVYALYNEHFTSYAIKKEGQNNIWVAGMRGDSGHTLSNTEFSNELDRESANSGWQLIKDQQNNYYLYNVGAKQFAQTPTDISACTFTDEQTPIQVTQLEGGFAFNTNGARTQYFCAAPQLASSPIAVWESSDDGSKWVLVENPNLLADFEIINTITAIQDANLKAAPAVQGIFNLAGQRLNVADPRQLPRGLYIVNGRKYLVK